MSRSGTGGIDFRTLEIRKTTKELEVAAKKMACSKCPLQLQCHTIYSGRVKIKMIKNISAILETVFFTFKQIEKEK